MVTITLSNGRELSVPLWLLGVLYVSIVLAVIAYGVGQFLASRDNTAPPRLWFQIGPSRRIPPWDWAVQLTFFTIAAATLFWLLQPPTIH